MMGHLSAQLLLSTQQSRGRPHQLQTGCGTSKRHCLKKLSTLLEQVLSLPPRLPAPAITRRRLVGMAPLQKLEAASTVPEATRVHPLPLRWWLQSVMKWR